MEDYENQTADEDVTNHHDHCETDNEHKAKNKKTEKPNTDRTKHSTKT